MSGADPDDLREGRVDAIVARERHYAELQQEGFPVLLDTLWYAEIMYDRAAFPRIPYPCYEGIRRTMDVYDSHEMRKYEAEDFYDDRILRELEESGFIDQVYADVRGR